MKKSLMIISLFFIVSSLNALNTRSFKDDDYNDFLQGKLENIAIYSDGKIAPTIIFDFISLKSLVLWSVLTKHDITYVGSGNDGKIYVIKDNQIIKEFDTSDLIITAIFECNGNIYATGIPDGCIFLLTPDGLSQICKFDNISIWSYTIFKNKVYLGTGPAGKLFEFDGKTIREVISLKGENILSLCCDEKYLYIGMSDNGCVYKYDPVNNSVSTLYQLEEKEIKSLLISDTTLYIVANGVSTKQDISKKEEGAEQESALLELFKALQSQTMDKSLQTLQSFSETVPFEQPPPTKKPLEIKPPAVVSGSSIYTLNLNSLSIEKTLFIPNESILTISRGKDSSLYIGTEPEGKVYQIYPKERRFALLKDFNVQSIMNVISDNENNIRILTTGNPAFIYFVRDINFEKDKIRYESKIFDLGSISELGRVEVLPENITKVFVRCGNIKELDPTWSQWLESQPPEYKIKLPNSRFFQYALEWKKNEEIDNIKFYVLGQNHKPSIRELKVEGNESKAFTIDDVRKSYFVKISWVVEDIDNDNLLYSLFLKEVDSEIGYPVKNAQELTQNYYTLATISFPDGWYKVKLIASDLPSTPPDRSLTSEKESKEFLIDNTNPQVENLLFGLLENKVEAVIAGIAKDNLSNIVKIEYSIDGDNWRMVYPVDKVLDSKIEDFMFNICLKDLIPGMHSLTVRVMDSAGNLGIGKLIFKN
ncbi:MAG: hypothetical protein AB1765_03360 [Candidatus Hydrogenedentota bacterium]